MSYIITTLGNLVHQSAFFGLTWGNYLMVLVAFVFLYLAIKKGYEPLLLVPISFGMLLVNLYPDIMLAIEDSRLDSACTRSPLRSRKRQCTARLDPAFGS